MSTINFSRFLLPSACSPLLIFIWVVGTTSVRAADPLPSWNDTEPKKAILAFVEKVTRAGGADFVPPAQRIAVFDNDGTLWCEQPMYVQLAFALSQVQAMAPRLLDRKDQEPFRSILAGDLQSLAAGGERAMLTLVMTTHADTTSDQFEQLVQKWMATAKHPQTGALYSEMVYQPMLELLTHLRAQGFKTFIVSGGGVEFMRSWAEKVYGIPPEQVIGSSIVSKYELRDGQPVLARVPQIDFINDKAGKPVAIQRHIGRRPIMAFGNSDGDFEMLEWTTSGSGPRFGLLVHHTDAAREFAYDRESPTGRLARGLDEGPRRGWTVLSMRDDWKRIFPPQVTVKRPTE